MSIERNALIIGFTGPVYSGCSRIAEILSTEKSFEKYKFKSYSLSKTLREKFVEKYQRQPDENNRSELQDFGNELRKIDKAILVKETVKKIENDGVTNNIIIDSIRNIYEVYELRKFSNFYLIAVNAAFDIRFNRASERVKDISKYKFKLDDDRDSGIDEPEEGQKVQNCVDLADFLILNINDIKERRDNYKILVDRLEQFLRLIENPGSRYPSVVELGMNYAYCASTMSRCLQRSVGAAITIPISETSREEKIIAIGCNNSPNGVKSCYELYGKCYRKKIKEKYFENLLKCPTCGGKLDVPLTHSCGASNKIMNNHYFPYKNGASGIFMDLYKI